MANSTRKFCSWPKVFLFGDSITQRGFSKDGCWISLLSDYLQRRCDIVVRGFSGYNTRFCKILLPSILDSSIAKETVAMTIFLGANDANFKENRVQHVPLEEYKQSLKDMVQFAMSQGISREKIILISPPAFDAVGWGKECEIKGKKLTKDNTTTGLYAQACCKAAEEMGTKCVDLYSEMMKAEDFSPFLNDGLHLSEKGSTLLFSLLQPVIEKLTSHLPVVWFPFYDSIDMENVEKSVLEF